jgi:hypothetical protein
VPALKLAIEARLFALLFGFVVLLTLLEKSMR